MIPIQSIPEDQRARYPAADTTNQTDQPSYLWRSMVIKGGKRYEVDQPSEIAAECRIIAERRCKHIKCATILRADKEGINAGKFFLYRILK